MLSRLLLSSPGWLCHVLGGSTLHDGSHDTSLWREMTWTELTEREGPVRRSEGPVLRRRTSFPSATVQTPPHHR
jgi:hypothetical protein